MAADPILALRPADASSSAIAVSIANARSMLLEAETAVANAKQERDGGLLDAAPAALAASERKLKAAQDAAMETRERVEAVLGQLEARLVAARRSETLAEVEAAKVAAEDAGKARSAWWLANQVQLSAVLQEGARLEVAEEDALRRHAGLLAATQLAIPDAELTNPAPTGREAFMWQQDVVTWTKPVPPPQVFLPPSPQEQEQADRRRAHDVARENGTAPGGILGSGRANLRSVS